MMSSQPAGKGGVVSPAFLPIKIKAPNHGGMGLLYSPQGRGVDHERKGKNDPELTIDSYL
jgi:hypothetical protein